MLAVLRETIDIMISFMNTEPDVPKMLIHVCAVIEDYVTVCPCCCVNGCKSIILLMAVIAS